jgi:hypothetical protein
MDDDLEELKIRENTIAALRGVMEQMRATLADLEEGDDVFAVETIEATKVSAVSLEGLLPDLVRLARSNWVSWDNIGLALGTTRQLAHERYGQAAE